MAREKKTSKYVAIKALKKSEILRLKQVDHVMAEVEILFEVDHPFIVRRAHP